MEDSLLKFINSFIGCAKKSGYVKIGVEQVFDVPYEIGNTFVDAILYDQKKNSILLCIFKEDLGDERLNALLRRISEYSEFFVRSKKYQSIKEQYDWSGKADYEDLAALLSLRTGRDSQEIMGDFYKHKKRNASAIQEIAAELGTNTELKIEIFIIVKDTKRNNEYFWSNKELLIDDKFKLFFFDDEAQHLYLPEEE